MLLCCVVSCCYGMSCYVMLRRYVILCYAVTLWHVMVLFNVMSMSCRVMPHYVMSLDLTRLAMLYCVMSCNIIQVMFLNGKLSR